jgi:hypothetical protein
MVPLAPDNAYGVAPIPARRTSSWQNDSKIRRLLFRHPQPVSKPHLTEVLKSQSPTLGGLLRVGANDVLT